jgi:hypothetical protein
MKETFSRAPAARLLGNSRKAASDMRYVRLVLLLVAATVSPISSRAQAQPRASKWLFISHVDNGAMSAMTFNAWLDTSHVERLDHGHIGAWMLIDNRATDPRYADYMVIDCNRRRYEVEVYTSYDAAGVRTHVNEVHDVHGQPVPENERAWFYLDPVHLDWEDRIADSACRRWERN